MVPGSYSCTHTRPRTRTRTRTIERACHHHHEQIIAGIRQRRRLPRVLRSHESRVEGQTARLDRTVRLFWSSNVDSLKAKVYMGWRMKSRWQRTRPASPLQPRHLHHHQHIPGCDPRCSPRGTRGRQNIRRTCLLVSRHLGVPAQQPPKAKAKAPRFPCLLGTYVRGK